MCELDLDTIKTVQVFDPSKIEDISKRVTGLSYQQIYFKNIKEAHRLRDEFYSIVRQTSVNGNGLNLEEALYNPGEFFDTFWDVEKVIFARGKYFNMFKFEDVNVMPLEQIMVGADAFLFIFTRGEENRYINELPEIPLFDPVWDEAMDMYRMR